jgi:hypothetical protein
VTTEEKLDAAYVIYSRNGRELSRETFRSVATVLGLTREQFDAWRRGSSGGSDEQEAEAHG